MNTRIGRRFDDFLAEETVPDETTAVADLVPGLHRRSGAKATRTSLIFVGIGTIAQFHCGH